MVNIGENRGIIIYLSEQLSPENQSMLDFYSLILVIFIALTSYPLLRLLQDFMLRLESDKVDYSTYVKDNVGRIILLSLFLLISDLLFSTFIYILTIVLVTVFILNISIYFIVFKQLKLFKGRISPRLHVRGYDIIFLTLGLYFLQGISTMTYFVNNFLLFKLLKYLGEIL